MIHGPNAARVLALALRMSRELGDAAWCPPLRMGVHSGTAVRRGADWYGSTVNVAARLADAATAGEVLISLTTRSLIDSYSAMTIADVGARRLKNVGVPVGVFVAAA